MAMATTAALVETGPVDHVPSCCGVEMLLHPGVAYECASAYFELLDADALSDTACSPPKLASGASFEHRDRMRHLVETRLLASD